MTGLEIMYSLEIWLNTATYGVGAASVSTTSWRYDPKISDKAAGVQRVPVEAECKDSDGKDNSLLAPRS